MLLLQLLHLWFQFGLKQFQIIIEVYRSQKFSKWSHLEFQVAQLALFRILTWEPRIPSGGDGLRARTEACDYQNTVKDEDFYSI